MNKAIVRITNRIVGVYIDKAGEPHDRMIPITESKSKEIFKAIKEKRKHVKSISVSDDFLDYYEITLIDYTDSRTGLEETYTAELNTDLTKLIFGNDEDVLEEVI